MTRIRSFSLIAWDVHVNRWPWMPTAAWATLLGVTLALPWGEWHRRWRDILFLLAVTDPLWGAWWTMATWTPAPEARAAVPFLPYMRPFSPWTFVHRYFPPGFLSAWGGVTLLTFWAAAEVNERLLWMSFITFVFAGVIWWLRWVHPRRLRWVHPVYGLGLPLWAGGYVFGREDKILVGVTLLVLGMAWLWMAFRQGSEGSTKMRAFGE